MIGEAIVEYVSIPLLGLPSGVYTASMTYFGSAKKDTVASMKRFYIVNPEMPPELAKTFSEDELFQQSEFSTYSENRIDEEYEKAKCLANSQEQSLWSALGDLTAKQKFMFRFWKEKDPNTETFVNERLEEFRKSINYSNTYFTNPQFREGRGPPAVCYGRQLAAATRARTSAASRGRVPASGARKVIT